MCTYALTDLLTDNIVPDGGMQVTVLTSAIFRLTLLSAVGATERLASGDNVLGIKVEVIDLNNDSTIALIFLVLD
jgi:hypothetical protein